uniref:Putative secreted protein n=1 Tax=Anopheles darlingi TaxID=43151 RepID=A0A2M4DF92_ANODA
MVLLSLVAPSIEASSITLVEMGGLAFACAHSAPVRRVLLRAARCVCVRVPRWGKAKGEVKDDAVRWFCWAG